MIISSVYNATFESTYYSAYTGVTSYTNLTISGVNAIGVYNYIPFIQQLSSYSSILNFIIHSLI